MTAARTIVAAAILVGSTAALAVSAFDPGHLRSSTLATLEPAAADLDDRAASEQAPNKLRQVTCAIHRAAENIAATNDPHLEHRVDDCDMLDYLAARIRLTAALTGLDDIGSHRQQRHLAASEHAWARFVDLHCKTARLNTPVEARRRAVQCAIIATKSRTSVLEAAKLDAPYDKTHVTSAYAHSTNNSDRIRARRALLTINLVTTSADRVHVDK